MHSHTSVRSIQAVLILFAGTSLLIGCTAQDLQTLQQAHDQAFYGPNYPEMKKLNSQIKALDREIAAQEAAVVDKAKAAYAAQQQKAAAQKAKDSQSNQIAPLPDANAAAANAAQP